jgi:ATP-dependent Lhr-like helicase
LRSEVKPDEARMQLVRGHLEIRGPVTAAELASIVGLDLQNAEIALEQLELQGFVLRGRFREGATATEWCERRLLARIHRLTMDGLRRQVAPVDTAGYMRFLLAHHGVVGSQPTGSAALGRVVKLLQGFETSAGAWESDLLPSRLEYDTDSLDQLFARGEVVWGRLDPPIAADDTRGQVLTRVSPIALAQRADLPWLLPAERAAAIGIARWDAQQVYEALGTHGALFFHDLLAVTNLLPTQLEDALRELAAMGLVTSDGFAAVRAVCAKAKDASRGRRRRAKRQAAGGAYSHGGRWSKFPPLQVSVPAEARTEKWAWQLLQRYGVMFRDLLARESLAPPWGELARVYRRLEMRGEIRGGRFVSGVAGEQFALPEAVEILRKHREEPTTDTWSVVSAADPLNLVGILTSAPRVPALRSNRVAYMNGRAVAAREAREIRWLADVPDDVRAHASRLLSLPGSLRRREEFADPDTRWAEILTTL